MKVFAFSLEKEAEKRIKKIENSDLNVLKKSLEASLVLGDAFQQLRDFITNYTFKSEAEEIEFFKVIKPRLYHRLIYYLRGRIDTALYLESFHYERDPMFSTNADFKVARIMANELLLTYLTKESEALEQQQMEKSLSRVRITWMGTKTELYEQIFAWNSRKVFGDVPLSRLLDYVSAVFNIELNPSYSRTFADMRIRNKQTPFLDSLKEALIKRMQSWKRDRKRK